MTRTDRITLRCPDCKRTRSVKRDATDYPEAVRVEVPCDRCDSGGDFPEVMQFDAVGRHITRDPGSPSRPDNLSTGSPLSDTDEH